MQIYLPPSATHYQAKWPINQQDKCTAMAILYDIVVATSPELVVTANSINPDCYLTICEAMSFTSTNKLIYSAAAWPKVEGEAIKRFMRNHYPSFSYTVEQSATQSLEQFSKESIDLLLLESCNLSIEETKHLLRQWEKKVKQSGIIATYAESDLELNDPSYLKIKTGKTFLYLKINNPNNQLKMLLETITKANGLDFYQQIGCFWQNMAANEKKKKIMLFNQIKKKLIADNG